MTARFGGSTIGHAVYAVVIARTGAKVGARRPRAPERNQAFYGTLASKEGPAMNDRSTIRCVGCRARPPETETTYTLIERYGWRLTVVSNEHGRKTAELCCPICWAARRSQARSSDTHRSSSASSLPPAKSESRIPSSKKHGLRPNRFSRSRG
jgi:hypothetical protein